MTKERTTRIGDALRSAIDNSTASRYQIAKATGVPQTSLMRFMRRETSLRLDKAESLADYLGLQLVPKKNKPAARRRQSRKV